MLIRSTRPTRLLHVVFKIITKILVNRVNPMVGKMIKFSQTAFLYVGPYFHRHQGLRQGDLLSPLLFYFVGDVLVIMVERAVGD